MTGSTQLQVCGAVTGGCFRFPQAGGGSVVCPGLSGH